MRRMHIPIISLMRSGSSELVADLALNSPVAMRSLGEPFNERRGSTFKGVPGDPSKNDPLKLLRAKATRNMTASRFFVFKVFSGHLALPQLGRKKLHCGPEVRASVLLELLAHVRKPRLLCTFGCEALAKITGCGGLLAGRVPS